jgi:hypothetical protein
MREPLFILSPPRSFSSLISSMIGQHPEMHAFPELQVFGHESLLDMMIQNLDLNRMASPGSIRSIAEVHEQVQTNESCTRAWLWIQKHSDMSPVDFFNYLREQIDPLIAVEKTPPNTLKISRLGQIITAYPNAKFLHLTRSVVGNHKSLQEYLADMLKLLKSVDSEQPTAQNVYREYPASIWLVSHRNILSVKPIIKQGHYLRLKGEDVLNKPSGILRQLCQWMEIDSSPSCIEAMMRPHESPYACIGPRIAYGGNDGKFMRQPVLRLKPPKTDEVCSFRETPNAKQLQLDNPSLFAKYKQLSSEDSTQIEKWMSHLYCEIKSMQIRLGY